MAPITLLLSTIPQLLFAGNTIAVAVKLGLVAAITLLDIEHASFERLGTVGKATPIRWLTLSLVLHLALGFVAWHSGWVVVHNLGLAIGFGLGGFLG